MKKIVYCKISMSVLLMGLLMLGMDVGPNAVPGLRPLAVWRLFSRPVVFACSLLISVLWLWGRELFIRWRRCGEWLYTVLILSAPVLMTLICETACNADLTKMNPVVVWGDFGIAFVVMAAGYPFFKKVSRWLGGLFLLAFFVGCVEYYVLLFRGVPLMMVDLLAWRAAAAVAGHYRFAVSAQLAAAILLTAFLTVLAAVRCYAGLKLSAVERFLLKMRRTIPAINVNGYFAGGSWHGKDERTEYSSLLRDYSYVQHYIMFDENKKKTLTCAGN